MITNITGMFLQPLKKFKNIASSKVASAIIEKINTSPDGVYFLDYDDLKPRRFFSFVLKFFLYHYTHLKAKISWQIRSNIIQDISVQLLQKASCNYSK